MPDLIRPKINTVEFWQANPTYIPPRREFVGEWVVDPETSEIVNVITRFGDGINSYFNLPITSGPPGLSIVGPPGEFTGITDLMGTSTTSMVVGEGSKTFIAEADKSWKIGLFLQAVSVESPESYMIGQVTAYDNVTGQVAMNVGLGGSIGAGTFNSWNISYAPGASVEYPHKDSHRPGGSDAIDEVTDAVSGLFPASWYTKFSKYEVLGIRRGVTIPADLEVGEIFFAESQEVMNPPVINTVQDQYVLLNEIKNIPIYLYHDYDVNSVTLTVASSNTADVPLTAITKSGTGNTRNIAIAAREGACTSVLTVTATDINGLIARTTFSFNVVTTAYTVTATNTTDVSLGTISPIGVITVPSGGSLAFTGIGADGYALDTVDIGAGDVLSDAYTFTNITENKTISAKFGPAFNITVAAPTNGTVTPSGVVQVANGHDKTFTFLPADGYINKAYSVDGIETISTNNSYTFTGVTSAHSITARFSGLEYTIILSPGVNGSITGPTPLTAPHGGQASFTFVPDSAYYEVLSASYAILGQSPVTLGSVSGTTVTNITDELTVYCTFRIKAPQIVTGFSAVDAGTGTTVNLAWTQDTNLITSYVIFYSDTLTTAGELKASGTAIPLGNVASYTAALTQDTTYKFIVVGVNSTLVGATDTIKARTGIVSAVKTATPTNAAPFVLNFTAELL